MGKTVFLFPGQGSQEVGMGQDLFRQDDHFVSLLDKASECAGEDLKRVCFKGPPRKLAQPRFLQPLLVAISLGYLRRVNEKGIHADYVLGHSLGEITALAASGVVDSSAAIAIAAKRGELMEEAAAACEGLMMAVLSITPERIEALIDELHLQESVVIANYNSPSQSVVSGDRVSCDLLSEAIVRAGGRCSRLTVAGPWHSPCLNEAYGRFQIWVEPLVFKTPRIPLILNGSGQSQADPLKIKQAVSASLINPVRFTACMQFCADRQADAFLEIGPGRVLSGLVRANGFRQTTRVYSVNNLRGVALAAAGFAGKGS